jgi:hypothetical protein
MAEIIEPGRAILLLVDIALGILVLYYMKYADVSKTYLRKIAGIEAIEEVVGRCAEMGRPVHTTLGSRAQLVSEHVSAFISGLSIVNYVARLTARYNTRIMATVMRAEGLPLIEDTISSAYAAEGKLDQLDLRQSVIYCGEQKTAFYATASGLIVREKAAGNVMVGPFGASESTYILSAAANAQAIQVGGSNRLNVMPMHAAICDYLIIAEELYAAGAYLNRNEEQIASLAATDIVKYVLIAYTILGIILYNIGIPILKDLLLVGT